jgi:hypothetical protein
MTFLAPCQRQPISSRTSAKVLRRRARIALAGHEAELLAGRPPETCDPDRWIVGELYEASRWAYARGLRYV